MSTGDVKSNPPKRVEEVWEEKRKGFLDAINDRIRTMALGSLVLIWGLFIGEAHKDVSMRKGSRISLLMVALGSVTVLLFEYVEQWAGYLGAKQALPGSKVKPYGFPYTEVSRRSFKIKHLLGVGTIIALIVVLGLLLIQTAVQAQTANDMRPYIGNWCGSDRDGNNYMHLTIEHESDRSIVRFNWKERDPTECSIVHADTTSAEFRCENNELRIEAKRDNDNLNVRWQRTGDEHEQSLVTCRTQ